MPSALHGIVVIELSAGIAGAMAGMLLADNGADVIMLDLPDPLDDTYPWSPTVWDRGKRSVVADPDDPGDRERVHALIAGADVVIGSDVDGVATGWGLTDDTLARVAPRLISCCISGYGRGNRHAGRPAIDALVAARMGLMADQRGFYGGAPAHVRRRA